MPISAPTSVTIPAQPAATANALQAETIVIQASPADGNGMSTFSANASLSTFGNVTTDNGPQQIFVRDGSGRKVVFPLTIRNVTALATYRATHNGDTSLATAFAALEAAIQAEATHRASEASAVQSAQASVVQAQANLAAAQAAIATAQTATPIVPSTLAAAQQSLITAQTALTTAQAALVSAQATVKAANL